MKALYAFMAAALLLAAPVRAEDTQECDVPGYLLYSDYVLQRVSAAVRDSQRLTVVVLGTGSSLLPGPDGATNSYPARLEAALSQRLKGVEVKVISHARPKQTAEDVAQTLGKILIDDKPNLVVWQTGTVDAMRGVDPDKFRQTLEDGIVKMQSVGTDVILMNMQYSPRTETVLALGNYGDNIRWVTQERGVPLFDRLGIMHYWSDTGAFDFDRTTKNATMARQVHDCIGRALGALVIEAAHLDALKAPAVQ